jgi:predicted transcriptional regulator
MIRIEVFQNKAPSAKGREFVAILEVLERKENGKRAISTCMNFFRSSASEAEEAAVEFVRAEREREDAARAARKRARRLA